MTEQQRAAMQQALEAMLHFPGDISDEMFESIRSLKAALAEPEPVAIRQYSFAGCTDWQDGVPDRHGAYEMRTVCTTPPARRPLPYAEIDRIADSIDPSTLLRVGKRLFARAIERAHGIGGNDE